MMIGIREQIFMGGLHVSSYTDKHYDFTYKLSKEEIEKGEIKLDPYIVASAWKLGERDNNSGILFHILKTIPRFGLKNDEEREIQAIIKQAENLRRFIKKVNVIDVTEPKGFRNMEEDTTTVLNLPDGNTLLDANTFEEFLKKNKIKPSNINCGCEGCVFYSNTNYGESFCTIPNKFKHQVRPCNRNYIKDTDE